MPNNPTARNMLTYTKRKALDVWLTQNASRLHDSPTTLESIASQASSALGFLVNEVNIRNLANDIGLKLTYVGKHQSKQASVDPIARHYIAKLYSLYGEKVPQELLDYLNADKLPNNGRLVLE